MSIWQESYEINWPKNVQILSNSPRSTLTWLLNMVQDGVVGNAFSSSPAGKSDFALWRQAGRARKKLCKINSGKCLPAGSRLESIPIWTVRQNESSIAWFWKSIQPGFSQIMLTSRNFEFLMLWMTNLQIDLETSPLVSWDDQAEYQQPNRSSNYMIAQSKIILRYPSNSSIHLLPFISRNLAFDQERSVEESLILASWPKKKGLILTNHRRSSSGFFEVVPKSGISSFEKECSQGIRLNLL